MRPIRLFQLGIFLLHNLSNAQSLEPTLKLQLVHLENDYRSADMQLIAEIESFYKLSIQKDESTIMKTDGKQFNVRNFIQNVEDTLTARSNVFYVFFTEKPIYIGQEELLLRGFASKRAAIVSTFKIKSQSKTSTEYESILLKTFLHEIGHLLGLTHCENSEKCFMVTSFPERLFLNSENKLCDSCATLVKIHLR
jgi:predicted Zn-dependent protease